jgi:hypothetical protein
LRLRKMVMSVFFISSQANTYFLFIALQRIGRIL